MRIALTIWTLTAVVLLTACSGSDPVTPDTQKAAIRFYNGNTAMARVEINNSEVFASQLSGGVSGRTILEPTTDSIEIRAFDVATNAIVARRRTTLNPLNYSLVLFPSTAVFNCVRRPEECVLREDASAPPSGRARIRVINATKDGTELSLKLDGMEVLPSTQLGICTISNVVDIEAGEHDITLLRTTNEQYEAAYGSVTLKAGVSYTVLLSGSLSFEDTFPFRARMYSDDDATSEMFDLRIPPDVGKYQIVNAVAGLKAFEARVDGAPKPQTANIQFSESSGYVDLEIGTHTTGVFVNTTPLIQETLTTTTLRSRKTLFVTGSMVPPNIAGIEVVDLVQPLSQNSATIRVMHLSPDAPALDFYRIVNGIEVIIDGCALMEFRQASSTANGKMQFTELPAGQVTILAKKANTQTIVLAPTQVTLAPGEVSTLWLGGLSSAAKLYHVKHN
jgi:hypothetical protein